MRVEEEYTDVLQNIEFAIVDVYRQFPNTSDYEVMRALEALIDAYNGEKIGRPPRDFNLSDNETRLVNQIRQMCEWRLGRSGLEVIEPEESDYVEPNPLTIDEIILCLKRILKSVKMWNKEGGRQGYLTFIRQFVF